MKCYIHRNYSLTAKLLSGQQDYFQIGKTPYIAKSEFYLLKVYLLESMLNAS